MITIQDFVVSRGDGRWGKSDLHLILAVKFMDDKTLFHLFPSSLSELTNKAAAAAVQNQLFSEISIIWCEESRATSI